MNYNHIGRYERGGQLPGGSTLQELRSNSTGPRPSAHKLRAMADALGVTTDYLLGGSEDNSLKADIDDVHGGTSVAGAMEGAERRTRSYWICFAGSRSYRKTRSDP